MGSLKRRLTLLVATAALAAAGCSEEAPAPPEAAPKPKPSPLAAAAARAQALTTATANAKDAAKTTSATAASKPVEQIAYQPPFPEREDLFSPPKHMGPTVRATGERSAESVVLMGFANLGEPRVVLAIDGVVTPLAHEEEAGGVKVIAISPPEAVLQRGRSRWTASIQ